MQSMPSPEPKPAPPPVNVRNSTYEFIASRVREMRDAAVNAVPAYETVEASVHKLDAKGKPILDADGYPTLITKRLLKRDVVADEWSDRVADAEKACE